MSTVSGSRGLANISSISWNDFHDTTLSNAQQDALAAKIRAQEVESPNLAAWMEARGLTTMTGAQYNLLNNPVPAGKVIVTEAQARATIAQMRNNSAIAFVTASGEYRYLTRNSSGTIAVEAAGTTYAQLASRNYQTIITSVHADRARATTALGNGNNSQITYFLDANTGLIRQEARRGAEDHRGVIVYSNSTEWFMNGNHEAQLRSVGYNILHDTVDYKDALSGLNTKLMSNYTTTSVISTATLRNATRQNAIDASRLDISRGGGIKYYDGAWFVNGEQTNLARAYLAVRVNTLWNVQNGQTILLNRIQSRNKLLDQANDFLTKLNAKIPTDTTSTVDYNKIKTDVIDPWKAKFGTTVDPFSLFSPNSGIQSVTTGSFKQSQMQTWVSEVQSYISTQQTGNSTDQTYLQDLANRQSESIEAISNFNKAWFQSLQAVGRNYGNLA